MDSHDAALAIAGVLGSGVAVVHGHLGDELVVRVHPLARDFLVTKAREQAGLIDGQQRLVDELVLTALQDQEVTLRLQTLVARIDLDHALGGALPNTPNVATAAR